MSRLIDASVCPDCRSPLNDHSTCTGCGLVLSGPLASRLWGAMVNADSLVEQLRREAVPSEGSPADDLPPMPANPSPAPRRRALPSASVPTVLLSLGALCLLVAAVVFVAVAWSVLGLAGRTAVLLGVTALLAGISFILTRRGLRGSAETFWLVVSGMLALDLVAAHSAGLAGLDGLSWRGTSAMVGCALLALGAGVALWARRQPVQRLYGVQGVAVAGTLLVTATNAWAGRHDTGLDVSVAVPVLVGLALLAGRRLRAASFGIDALAVVSWLVLLAAGVDRAAAVSSASAWWSGLDGWPLLFATVYAAAPTFVARIPRVLRTATATASLVALAIFVLGPLDQPTHSVLVASGVLVVLATLSRFAPSVWSTAAGILTGLGLLGAAVSVLVRPLQVASDALGPLDGTTHMGLTRHLFRSESGPAPWTAVLVAVVILVAFWGALAHLRDERLTEMLRNASRAMTPGIVGLGLGAFALGAGAPLWVPVAVLTVLGFASAAAAVRVQRDDVGFLAASALSAYLLLLAVGVATVSELLVAVVATLVALGLIAAHAFLRSDHAFSGGLTASAVAGTFFAAYAVDTWTEFLDVPRDSRAVAVAIVMGLTGVVARLVARDARSRIGLETTAFVVGLGAAGIATTVEAMAMVLTVVGTAVCLVAVINRDRHLVGWLGAAVLGVATVLRFVEEVKAPELYTLPAAAVLLAAGLWRMLHDEEANSVATLGSGLTLALLPSLLLSLDEPVSLRGALVGAAGVGVLTVGVARRWSGPFAAGAITTALLAVRHLGPVAEAVPRWISLGAVGLALLLVGVTWEQRRRNVETASRYLAALR